MRIIVILIFTLLANCVVAQNQNDIEIADALYSKKLFNEAISLYNKILLECPNDSVKNCRIYNNISKAYTQMGDLINAQVFLTKHIQTCNSKDEDLLDLASLLIQNGNYEKAKKVIITFNSRMPNLEKAKIMYESCDSALYWQNNQNYILKNELTINSKYDEIAPVLINGILYFSSTRENIFIQDKLPYNGQPPFAIYQAKQQSDDFKKVKKLHFQDKKPVLINFNIDQTEAFTTIHNTNSQQLEIHKLAHSNGKFGKFESFLFNNDSCSYAQVCLSPTGNTMYFVSDMKGGYGGTDIYFCEKKNGKWSAPQNLGPMVNTSENELFPYLYNGFTLYFASNGKVGMGGYDIYKVQIKNNECFNLENLKFPLNSSRDDLTIFFETSENGFISSNRKQGLGGFDIYSFKKR